MCALDWYAGQDPACTAVGYAQLVAVSSCAGDVVYRYRDRYQAAQVQVQVQMQVWPNNFNAYPFLALAGAAIVLLGGILSAPWTAALVGERLLTYVRAGVHRGTCCRA